MKEKITIIGAGYVGLNTAFDIWKRAKEIKKEVVFEICDKNDLRIANLQNDIELLKKIIERSQITIEELKEFQKYCDFKVKSEIDFEDENIFICINTTGDINIDRLNIFKIFNKIYTNKYNFKSQVIIRSTVPIGLTDELKNYFTSALFGHFPERYSPGDKLEFKNIFGGDWPIFVWLKNYFPDILYFQKSKITEAAKIYENLQRYTLISLANLMKIILNDFELNYEDIYNACSTKSNFIKVKPGLIGGECIGVDHKLIPHYLINAFDGFFETWNNYIYQQILDILKIKLDYENNYHNYSDIIFLGYEYKPNSYSWKNSKAHHLYNDLKKYFKKTFNIYGLQEIKKLIIDENFNKLKNKKIIILVKHDAVKELIQKLKENKIDFEILFDIEEFLLNFIDPKQIIKN